MAAPAWLLDLTRLVSRQGKGVPTGIDRVERAYLERLMQAPEPLFGLVQTSVGFLLLDRAGCGAVADLVRGRIAPPPATLFSRMVRRRDDGRARAEALLRRKALARTIPAGLGRTLLRHLPEGARYLNVGHANLSSSVMKALRRVPGLRIAVLVHDVIPLVHPEFCRPGTVEPFRRRMSTVAAHADLVIHSAGATRAVTEAEFARLGRVPPGVTAPLGVDPPVPGRLPPDAVPRRPHFVMLGTIEPRKNHDLLLDLWARFAPAADLMVIGGRGWADRATLARLDAGIPGVREIRGADDAEVAAWLCGARALLFPSRAEGFGLPAVEAAMLGCPVICSDLPVFREILGDKAVYLDPGDLYSWAKAVNGHIPAANKNEDRDRVESDRIGWPSWDGHFNKVLTVF